MNRTVKLLSILTVTGLVGFASLKFIPQSNATNLQGAVATFESDFDQKPSSLYSYPTHLNSYGKINVRSGPGTNHAVNYVVPSGAAVILRNDETGNDGYRWYYLSFEEYAFTGWVREDLIISPPDVQHTDHEQGEHADRPLPEQYVVLDSHYSNARINVRSGPGTSYRVRHYGLTGDPVEILNSSDGNDGYLWYQLAFVDSGAQGWVREDLLAFIAD